MQILFESRETIDAQLRERSIERVRFALRRLSGMVPRAKVLLHDINGPRGGVDKRCQVALETQAADTVVVVSVARNWRTALDRSLRRAIQTLTRGLARKQKPVRGRSARQSIDSAY